MDIRLESIRITCVLFALSPLDEAIFPIPARPGMQMLAKARTHALYVICYGLRQLEVRSMDEEGGTPGRVSELSELFRELQLLRLKYDQLVDVCLKLTESW